MANVKNVFSYIVFLITSVNSIKKNSYNHNKC